MNPLLRALCLAALVLTTICSSAIAQQDSGEIDLSPIPLEQAEGLALSFYSDVGYQNQDGRFYVDVLEQDFAYLTLIVTDPAGRPVTGATPRFEKKGKSLIVFQENDEERSRTGNDGSVDFGVIGGEMSAELDEITVIVGNTSIKLMVNVISLQAAGFPMLPTIEGALEWPQLMAAQIRWSGDDMLVDFPPEVAAQSGKTTKLSGFMMPLDPDLEQRRFLLTSNPPSCFFHIPGGPAGAIEVLAPEGIEATWDPLVLEGTFETLQNNEYGVIYRLADAKVVQQ